MILNTVALHNFMSYADARLDLTSVNVACLSGRNGAGKSALLDAVTWALWEAARAASDELIRLGEKEMWVEVSFAVDGRSYRVRRARAVSGGRASSKGTLDFQVDGDGQWRSLTAGTMKETQRSISDVLHMDYDTFINSVYLRQGKADEFTTRPPSERKQVLSEILGLSRFDRLQELAREKARELKGRAEQLEAGLSARSQVEDRLAAIAGETEETAALLAETSDKHQFSSSRLEDARARLQELRLIEQKAESGRVRLEELGADIASLASRRSQLLDRASELRQTVAAGGGIEERFNRFEHVRGEVAELDRKGLAAQDMLALRLELKSALAAARSRLELEVEHRQRRLAEMEGRLAELEKTIADEEKIKARYAEFRRLAAREADLSARQEAFARLTARAEELKALVNEARVKLEAELEQKRGALADLEALISSRQEIELEGRDLEAEAAELDRLEKEFDLVEERGLSIKSELETLQLEVSSLHRGKRENSEKADELERHSHSSICPLCSAPIVDRAAVVAHYMKLNEELDRQISALQERMGGLEGERQELRKRYLELRQRLDSRKALDMRIGRLNEKVAALARAEQSRDALAAETVRLEERLDRQDFAQVERESLVAVKTEIHKLDFDPVVFASLQAQMRANRYIESKHQELRKSLIERDRLIEELPRQKAALKSVSDELASESYGADLRAQLADAQETLEKLGYDRERHEQLKGELTQLMSVADEKRLLTRARAELPQVEEELARLEKESQLKAEQLSEMEAALPLWRRQLEQLPGLAGEMAQLEETAAELAGRKEELARQLAVLRSRQAQAQSDLEAMEGALEHLKETRQKVDDLAFLAEACGKKGIQAVIIENAVPEIENEANRILSRLSDNQMHVALATQHRTKSGTMVETLDLLIGDEIGTRSYELYSGGEAFKVDFALRLSLSRLLARRSGARLETLIIDEGFGSQDEVSRERMVRAINAIRADFARILVVTHLAELKEMFPVQIRVEKVDGSSQVQLIG